MALVGVITGSRTDAQYIQPCLDMLRELGVSTEVRVLSAHRQPDAVREYALTARDRGVEVIVAAAGMAAHLPGALASWTDLPVIGVPLYTSELEGMDSLMSIAQMPPGVPVACMAVNGARNAAVFAARILALKHDKIAKALADYRQRLQEA
jgi:5-(carboxyamino)imidazole ribonucleotide mutase